MAEPTAPPSKDEVHGESPPRPITYLVLTTPRFGRYDSFLAFYQGIGSLLRRKKESFFLALFAGGRQTAAVSNDAMHDGSSAN